MLNVLFAVASLVGLVIIAAIIISLLEFRKQIRILNESLLRIETSLAPAITSFAAASEEIREFVEGANSIKDDVKAVTGAGRELAFQIGKISDMLSLTSLKARASAEGLKVGIGVAARILKANFLKKEASEHEL